MLSKNKIYFNMKNYHVYEYLLYTQVKETVSTSWVITDNEKIMNCGKESHVQL